MWFVLQTICSLLANRRVACCVLRVSFVLMYSNLYKNKQYYDTTAMLQPVSATRRAVMVCTLLLSIIVCSVCGV